MREYGHGHLTIKKPGKLFARLPRKLRIWNSHGDKLTSSRPVLSRRPFRELALRRHRGRAAPFLRHQFHPEVFHTSVAST